jgi:hypothetical protein
MHEPSVRVLKAIAAALDLSADVLLAEAGMLERAVGRPIVATSSSAPGQTPAGRGEARPTDAATTDVERAVNADPRLASDQKAALIQVYRSYLLAASPPQRDRDDSAEVDGPAEREVAAD